MQAIAKLVEEDPYLKLSPSERVAERKRRRSKWAAPGKPDTPIDCRARKEATIPAIELRPIPPALFKEWLDRQERLNPLPKPAWFSIEAEIEPAPRKIQIREIQRIVALQYGVTVNDIVSARRTADVVRARQVAMYLARHMTPISLPEIGRRFGDRDHTTALFAVRKITRLLDMMEEGLRETIDGLVASLGGPVE